MLRLSPFHSVELAEAYLPLIQQAPAKDFPLHTIALKRAPDGRPLVHSELVIAGRQTRQDFPLAAEYPLHFLKSYHPWSYHRDPKFEFENTRLAAGILDAPPPIGHTSNTFRGTFIPGRLLGRLSPFTGVEPPERNLALARRTPPLALAGLWRLLEEAHAQLGRLHARRFCHGDLELANIIVCLSPMRVFFIDYETAESDFQGSDAEWEERRRRDLAELCRVAIYIQCALGRQEGALADESIELLPTLFRDPAPFRANLREVGLSLDLSPAEGKGKSASES